MCILAYATRLCWNAKVTRSKGFEAYNLDSRFSSSSLPVSKSEAHLASDSRRAKIFYCIHAFE